jgi:hypothetical protein
MAIVEAISIPIGVTGQESVNDAANSYEDLGDAVAKTQREAERLATTFGINDDRTKEAIKVAGRYKQEMEQHDFAIDGARGGVDTLFRATQGVVAGFEVAAGATALFGGQSEELEKILIKVQGAMVLGQGLKDIKEFGPAVKAATSGTLNWVKSLGLAKVALAGLGIGAIVVAFQAFKDQLGGIIDFFKDLSDSLGLTNFAAEELIKTQERNIDVLNRELAVMEAKGESEDKLYAKRLEIAQAEEKLAQSRLSLLKEGDEGYQDALKVAADASNAITVLSETETQRLKAAAEERAKTRRENVQAQSDAAVAEFEILAEQFLKLDQLERERINNSGTLAAQAQKKRFEQITIQKNQEEQILENLRQEALITEDEYEQKRLALLDYYDGLRKQSDAEYRRDRQLGFEEQLNDSVRFLQLSGQLAETFAGEDEKRAKKAFDINKGISIAEAIVNTYTGATAALAAKTELYPYERFVKAALVVSTGLAQVAQISKTKYNSKAGSTVASSNPSAVPRFNAPSTRIPGGGDEFTQVRRIYVTERDITNVQDKVRVTEGLSQF